MTDRESLDFTIRTLGECAVDSPLHLSHHTGDGIANYTRRMSRVLADNSEEAWIRFKLKGEKPPVLEVAGPREKIYFSPDKVWAGIVSCGGICPGTNDVIRGLVMELYHHYGVKNIQGFRFGYAGLAKDGEEPFELTPAKVAQIHRRGGSFLGSSRGAQETGEIVDTLERRKIDMLFTIGGDGTQRGALQIAAEAKRRKLKLSIVGIPKTIDNDLMYVGRTFGFQTAFTIARDAVTCAHAEAESARHGVAIVRLMGRESGYIAAKAALASGDANFVLIPEVPFVLDGEAGLIAALEKRLRERGHALIVVAEGAGQELLHRRAEERCTDDSGTAVLGYIGVFLRHEISERLKKSDVRPVVKYIDPTYLIRSAPAIASDNVFCLQLAQHAVHAAMCGRTEMVVGLKGDDFIHVPIAAAVSRRNVIDPDGELWRSVTEATGQPLLREEKERTGAESAGRAVSPARE